MTGVAATASLLFEGTADSERAPWDTGNTFAPWVLREDGRHRMWYGAQGRDGHDRIHYAESSDGLQWDRRGVVLEHPEHNLINDPCVVHVDGVYHLYYTVAEEWIVDTIHHAVSSDGLEWRRCGEILGPGPAPRWDALLVGRPSVLVEDGAFRMWFDGLPAFPPGLGQRRWPELPGATRWVGYAESSDGFAWHRESAPVHGPNVGSVHVVRVDDGLVMLHESREGVRLSRSRDGRHWTGGEVVVPAGAGALDAHGHVTPHLYLEDGSPRRIYLGLARSAAWTENVMGVVEIDPTLFQPQAARGV